MSEANAASSSRTSLDTASARTNGAATSHTDAASETETDTWQPISTMTEDQLRSELARVRDERDTFESQYHSLLSKLTTMRATLGDRLRQDAEELDRREAQIEQLGSQVETLESSSRTLRDELVASHAETDRLTTELDTLRKRVAANEAEAPSRERERELHEMLERVKLDASGWQASCLEERAKRQELETRLDEVEREVERARSAEAQQRARAESEAASAAELSTVLAEFQSSQEAELARALGDHRSQIDTLTSSLSDYRARAEHAESQLASTANLTSQAESLASQVKEKNLLIGKLRHEAVILNEHLTEALRRLRNDQSEANVDKRLVSNLLVKFLTTPRADGKRYEMLGLIGGVLGWGQAEREAVGLARSGAARPGTVRSASSSNGIGAGDESFGNLFVEFLLSEAESGKASTGVDAQTPSMPGTPIPSRLTFSPTQESFKPPDASPNSNATTPSASTDGKPGARPGGASLGSYFGLSRGGNK